MVRPTNATPLSRNAGTVFSAGASDASVEGGAGCAAAEDRTLADLVTPKLAGCMR